MAAQCWLALAPAALVPVPHSQSAGYRLSAAATWFSTVTSLDQCLLVK